MIIKYELIRLQKLFFIIIKEGNVISCNSTIKAKDLGVYIIHIYIYIYIYTYTDTHTFIYKYMLYIQGIRFIIR